MTPSSARVEGLARGLLQCSEPNSKRKEDQAMSQDQKTTNETRSIARQLARELHPEELDVVAAGCTAANCSTFCNDEDDTYAR
jgi:hypothetical protein